MSHTEFADVTDNLLKPHGPFSLAAVLSSPSVLPYFRSLSLTDQPRTRPQAPVPPSRRTKHLVLSLALPPGTHAGATRPLVEAAFKLVDVVAATGGWGVGKGPGGKGGAGAGASLAQSLRPETRAKLRATRERVERELREEAAREKRAEAEAERAAAKKKAEEERLAKLSAAEQKKVSVRVDLASVRDSEACLLGSDEGLCVVVLQALEREKKRLLRKSQGKVKVR